MPISPPDAPVTELESSDDNVSKPSTRIRIVVADDHGVVLKGLAQLFSEERDLELVAACPDGTSCVAAVERFRPDILVLDLRMPTVDGLAVLRELRDRNDPTPVVLLTAAITEPELLEAVRLGVRGIVLKEMAPKLLLQCLRKVHAGGNWIESETTIRALERLIRTESAQKKLREDLTPREIEIMKLVASGLSNTDVAAKLCLSEATVKSHLHAVYEKLRIRSRVDLVLFAKESGLS